MKNHEDNFDELHMENTDADFVTAYKGAIAVPDMWDRISAGFDAEMGKEVYAQQEKMDMSVADINHKKVSHHKRWIGLVAAVLLICIIAIPLISNGLMRSDRKNMDEVDEIAADNSYAESEWSGDEMAGESYDSAAAVGESYDSDVVSADSAGESCDDAELSDAAVSESYNSDGVSTELAAEDSAGSDEYTVKVSGSIYYKDGEYILTVAAVSENLDSNYTLHENDRIRLLNADGKINLADGEARKYDAVSLNSLELLNENSDAAPEYQALLITLN